MWNSQKWRFIWLVNSLFCHSVFGSTMILWLQKVVWCSGDGDMQSTAWVCEWNVWNNIRRSCFHIYTNENNDKRFMSYNLLWPMDGILQDPECLVKASRTWNKVFFWRKSQRSKWTASFLEKIPTYVLVFNVWHWCRGNGVASPSSSASLYSSKLLYLIRTVKNVGTSIARLKDNFA